MTIQEKFREIAYRTNGLSYPPKPRWAGLPRPTRKKWNSLEELADYIQDVGGRIKNDEKEKEGFLVVKLEDEQYDPVKCVLRPPLIAEVPMDFAMKVLTLGDFP